MMHGLLNVRFLKLIELPQNLRCHKVGMQQVPYWGSTNIGHHHTKFSRGDLVPMVSAQLDI